MAAKNRTIGSKAKIREVGGNSAVLTIPVTVLEESELEKGEEVYVTTDGGNVRVSLWE